ncbi:MAG TPA: hypothetical protein VN939_03990 [Chthoniobacterales bacterium]|jgi:hypothetical protein|nr:hypothetical protein [Chthoniobacterales bacterium]
MNSSIPDDREADIVIYLDYGVDCLFGYYSDIRLSDQGLVFRSRWRFDLGTQISLRVCAKPESPENTPVCVDLTGIVASCDRMYCRSVAYEVTLLFFDEQSDRGSELSRLTSRPELMGNLN